MKVCTDACLFGAWVAREVKNAGRMLDIGSGTGLLSLMYAQEHPATIIDAIEIDSQAAEQARANSDASPWKNRIAVHATPLQQFNPTYKYDLLISNPPFFEQDLRSSIPERNNAMHDTSLTLEELSQIAPEHLLPEGFFTVLLPYHRSDYFIMLMSKQGWYLNKRLLVKQSLQHDYFRSIMLFAKQPPARVQEEEMSIRTEKNTYSAEFINLLKGYYLYL